MNTLNKLSRYVVRYSVLAKIGQEANPVISVISPKSTSKIVSALYKISLYEICIYSSSKWSFIYNVQFVFKKTANYTVHLNEKYTKFLYPWNR